MATSYNTLKYSKCSDAELQTFVRARCRTINVGELPANRSALLGMLRVLDEAATFRFLALAPELRMLIYAELFASKTAWGNSPGLAVLSTNRLIHTEAQDVLVSRTLRLQVCNGHIDDRYLQNSDFDGDALDNSSISLVKKLHLELDFMNRSGFRLYSSLLFPHHTDDFFTPPLPDERNLLRVLYGLASNFRNLRCITLEVKQKCALPMRAFEILALRTPLDCEVVFADGFEIHQKGVQCYQELRAERRQKSQRKGEDHGNRDGEEDQSNGSQ